MGNGLITKNTDLKSLKYGSMPLGSDKPYVTKDIGQAPSSQIGLQFQSRVDDTSRIAQMLVNKPGLKYLANEALLQQVNAGDKISKAQKGGKSVAGAILQQIGGTFVNTVKIVGSTLAQVPVNGTGTHFLKGFRTDTYLQPTGGDRPSKFASFFGAGGIEGAPYALRGEIVPGTVGTNNENFGETSKITGKFNPAPSLFDYSAKVNSNRNEVANITKPEWASKEFYNSTLSSKGQVVSLGKTEIRPVQARNADTGELTTLPGFDTPFQQQPSVETTATPNINTKQNLIKSISHTGSIDGDVNPDSSTNVPSASYSYTNTYTGKQASNTINNAQTGAPIPVGAIETTAKSGSVNGQSSIQSKTPVGIIGSGLLSSLDNLPSASYSEGGSSYTGTSTVGNINAATRGDIIGTGITPTDLIQGQQISTAKQDKVDSKSSVEDTNTKNRKDTFKYGKTYTDEQADRKVDPNNSSTRNVIKEKRVGLGDQGKNSKATVPYWTKAGSLEVDRVNMLDVGDRQDAAGNARDMAKFYFEIITPDESKFLYFRAFIKNLDDSFNADWQARKYNGRAEDFYTYGGFNRDISISFTIAAATRNEMRPLYRKMVYLASATAPTYGTSGLMRGTLARITVGSYLDQIPGVITSVKYNLVDGAPWEIAMGEPEGVETDVQVLPMVMDCSISFKPIHDFAPQTGLKPFFTNSHEGVNFLN